MRIWLSRPGAAPSHSVMIGTRSTASTSLVTTVTLGSAAASRSAARSRSISTARSRLTCAASGRVIAPRPGPISRIESSGVAATALTSLVTQAASRKCCANRLRGLINGPWRKRRVGSNLFDVRRIRLAAPVALLDRHDFVFGHAEVMSKLVDQRFADRDDDLVLIVAAIVFDRMLEERDAIGQGIAVSPAALVQRRSLIQAEQRARVVDIHFVEQLVGRLVLDDDGEVAHLPRELQGNRVDRFLDELAKIFAGHERPRFLRELALSEAGFFDEEACRVEGWPTILFTAFAASFNLIGLLVNPSR